MKLHQILTASTFAIMGLMSPQSAVAAIGPELGLGQVSIGGATLNEPSDGIILLARRGSDDHDGDDHGQGRGRGGDDDHDDDHGSDDDHDGDRGRSNDQNEDDSDGSGRSRPRVPGGSGCDDAGDIAEHAACS